MRSGGDSANGGILIEDFLGKEIRTFKSKQNVAPLFGDRAKGWCM